MMIVRRRRGTLYRKSAERVIANDFDGSEVEERGIEGPLPRKLATGPEWALRVGIGADEVAIGARDGTESSVETGQHLIAGGNSDVAGKNRVQRASHFQSRPAHGDANACGLSEGMDTSVSSAGAEHRYSLTAKALHRFLEHSLYGPFGRLNLPARKSRPVVLQNELKDARFHGANYRSAEDAANTLTFIVVDTKLGNASSRSHTETMAPKTLATLATVLSAARDADAAVTLLHHEAVDVERSAQLALFVCDSRRQLITERLNPVGDTIARTPLAVAIDHLPAPIRRALNFGATVADFGAESDDYMKLLGVAPPQQGGILSVRGLTLDGELAGFIALYEPRRRFGPRVSERLAPAFDLFALAFERMAEHEARFEAVRTLEELTRNIHSEYNRAVKQLKAELEDARLAAASPGQRESNRIAELERLLGEAGDELQRRAERLQAVEDQVAQAVGRLEQAHVDLHSQSETARAHSNTIYQIQRILDASDGSSAADTVESIRAALSSPVTG